MKKLCALLLCLTLLCPALALAWEPPAEQTVVLPFGITTTAEEVYASREDSAMATVIAATNVMLVSGGHALDFSQPSYLGYFMNELNVMYFDGTEYIHVKYDLDKPDVFTFEPYGFTQYGGAQTAMWEMTFDFRDNVYFMLMNAFSEIGG